MNRVIVLAILFFFPGGSGLVAGCRNLIVPGPNDPTRTEKLMGLIGPASHVVAIVGLVKGNVRIAAAAEVAAFVKDTYDYLNKFSPEDRQHLEICHSTSALPFSLRGPDKPVFIGTKADINALSFSTPSSLGAFPKRSE